MPHAPFKVISGGQTGVDQAALEVALDLGIPCGGWCPKGRRCEYGVIPLIFPLQETNSPLYHVRTLMNISNSDGTLIIVNQSIMDRGTRLTKKICDNFNRPCLILDVKESQPVHRFSEWMDMHQIHILNVAGCRESASPGIHDQSKALLMRLFSCYSEK